MSRVIGLTAVLVGRRTRVLALADDQQITVIELTTGQVLSTHQIQPDRGYWRNPQRARPLAGLRETRPMTRDI